MATVGSTRTGEELGGLPGVPVVVSSEGSSTALADEADGTPRLVVATLGAAAEVIPPFLLLDGGALSSRPNLGAASEGCQWSNAVEAGGTVSPCRSLPRADWIRSRRRPS